VLFHVDIPYEREKRLSISLEWVTARVHLRHIKSPLSNGHTTPVLERYQKRVSVFVDMWAVKQPWNDSLVLCALELHIKASCAQDQDHLELKPF
jgi:hypothetical protein